MAPGDELALGADGSGHVIRVLRMRPGDPVVLFNGDGNDYPAVVTHCHRRQVHARVDKVVAGDRESPLRLVLAQALVSNNKMDLVVQKATELGVQGIVVLVTERATVALDGKRSQRRLAHWRAIATAACEQSGRAVIPAITPPQGLHPWCARGDHAPGARLLLAPDGGQRLRELPHAAAAATLVVGPEGGLSGAEMETLAAAGFTRLALGPRVLRTETAGLAALAALQARWGDF